MLLRGIRRGVGGIEQGSYGCLAGRVRLDGMGLHLSVERRPLRGDLWGTVGTREEEAKETLDLEARLKYCLP